MNLLNFIFNCFPAQQAAILKAFRFLKYKLIHKILIFNIKRAERDASLYINAFIIHSHVFPASLYSR